jgi:hypothetical protein
MAKFECITAIAEVGCPSSSRVRGGYEQRGGRFEISDGGSDHRSNNVAYVLKRADGIESLASQYPVGIHGRMDLGWTEGDNIRIDIRRAMPNAESIQRFAKELVALQPDLILTQNTPKPWTASAFELMLAKYFPPYLS